LATRTGPPDAAQLLVHFHPEEVLADNFATLMEWRSDGVLPPANPGGFPANDVELLTAIEGVLASGCKRR